jgi:adenylyltransferase/sulfurtransferase
MGKKTLSELLKRYSRQTLVDQIGIEGQKRLCKSAVLVIGCGALGSAAAILLVRAGTGSIRIVDRDDVKIHNLHRQFLFDEEDVKKHTPKAKAAARALRKVNSTVKIEGIVDEVTSRNILDFMDGIDVVLDGTDNFESRYLINDACISLELPWIYGGVMRSSGMTHNVLPGRGPCFRCIYPDVPPPTGTPVVDTVGVLNSVPMIIASIQATEACKILTGSDAVRRSLLYIDVWESSFRHIRVSRSPHCPTCVERRFPSLLSPD